MWESFLYIFFNFICAGRALAFFMDQAKWVQMHGECISNGIFLLPLQNWVTAADYTSHNPSRVSYHLASFFFYPSLEPDRPERILISQRCLHSVLMPSRNANAQCHTAKWRKVRQLIPGFYGSFFFFKRLKKRYLLYNQCLCHFFFFFAQALNIKMQKHLGNTTGMCIWNVTLIWFQRILREVFFKMTKDSECN